ncbi:hypothetical protein BCAR13_120176 [Paraburkholderia caribensis]|nr:hypothetical protein BCAR13_120176 [Paraburkholderia caribensis]
MVAGFASVSLCRSLSVSRRFSYRLKTDFIENFKWLNLFMNMMCRMQLRYGVDGVTAFKKRIGR